MKLKAKQFVNGRGQRMIKTRKQGHNQVDKGKGSNNDQNMDRIIKTS